MLAFLWMELRGNEVTASYCCGKGNSIVTTSGDMLSMARLRVVGVDKVEEGVCGHVFPEPIIGMAGVY